MAENVTALNEIFSSTTINSPDTSENVFSVENLEKELQDFIEISERKLEFFKNTSKELSSRKGVDWNEYRGLSEKYELLTKEINHEDVKKTQLEGEIHYCQRRLPVMQQKIEELNQLIHESVIKVHELHKETAVYREKAINKHSALQQAMKYYKTRFNIHVNVIKSEDAYMVQICFFTEKFDDTYSATLLMFDEDNKKWKLENVKPAMEKPIVEQLQRRLEETNDINEIFCSIRRHFKNNMV